MFDKELEFYMRSVGAVQIVGPKWCGKSTTAKRHAKTNSNRRMAGDFIYFEFAKRSHR